MDKLPSVTSRRIKETRVNLRHLLEDIRDSYPYPVEETIIVEIVANGLDAQPSEISFTVNRNKNMLSITDNGSGMNQSELERYHDIAATTKLRGKGIGFAGIGAKLSLLLATVTTETKTRTFHAATQWWLESERRAPWKSTPPKGKIAGTSGTSITITLINAESPLLDSAFIRDVVIKHFYPLMDSQFNIVLGNLYRQGIKFYIDNSPISPAPAHGENSRSFLVYLGRRKRPVGTGFVLKSDSELPEDYRGIAISTYGKVIKRGWDWLGLTVINPLRVTGVVEIPALSEILTTNKSDFLRDSASLKKYWSYRKAIQSSITQILQKLGELASPAAQPEKKLRPLEKEIEHVLDNIIQDFPELSPLLGRRPAEESASGVIPDDDAPLIGRVAEGVDPISGTEGGPGEGSGMEIAPGDNPGERIEPGFQAKERGNIHEGRKKGPSLMVGYEDNPELVELGRLRENTIWINRSHPAYRKTGQGLNEKYYVHIAIAWVLSRYLEEDRSPLDFINQYLRLWGEGT